MKSCDHFLLGVLCIATTLVMSCADNQADTVGKADVEEVLEHVPVESDTPAKPELESSPDSPVSVEVVTDTPPERPRGSRGGERRPDWRNMSEEEREERRRQFLAEADKNGDGNLGKDEVPERMWNFMSRADKNGDDMVTEAERIEFRAERETERMLRELSGEEPEGFDGRRGRGPGGGFGGKGDRENAPGSGSKSQQ